MLLIIINKHTYDLREKKYTLGCTEEIKKKI